MKINKLQIMLLLILCSSALNSTLKAQENMTEFDKNFVHTVFFWLHNPDNQEDRTAFETSLKKFLNASLYANTHFIGEPANTPRDVVDSSYTYSLVLTFPSREVQDKYQKEDAHLVFIEESSHLWDKVVVYDSVGISK